jgi:hypothetical protein
MNALSQNPPSHGSSQARRAIYISLILLLILMGGEVLLRIWDWAHGASPQARTYWYWAFAQDRYLGFRARPNLDIVLAGGTNHIDTNSEGYRSKEVAIQSKTERRLIVCVGESSTCGIGCSNDLYDFRKYPLLDDCHLSDAGNDHLAEILAPRVIQALTPRASAESGRNQSTVKSY